MAKRLKKIRKIVNFFKKHRYKNILLRLKYTKFYETKKINNKIILAQTYAGTNFSGNIYYLVESIINRNDLMDFKIYVVITKNNYKKMKKFIQLKFNNNVKIVKMGSTRYLKLLASAKYLLNNVAFPTYFVKKEGQIYLNTWHGTPLKGLGRSIKDAPNESGNYQRNFLMCDYLIFPNEYTFDIMRSDYMISQFFNGKYVLSGYPRNCIFFDEDKKSRIRKEFDLLDKEVIVYMPTWRRSKNVTLEEQMEDTSKLLSYLDKKLTKNQVLYVKFHNLVNKKIDFLKYKKVKEFPNNIETYEFLSISDVLITDYSSVMFDYLNNKKKIILYIYDLDDYISNRSIYFNINDLSFSKCSTKEDLLKEINSIDKSRNYINEQKRFCSFDGPETTNKILDLLFYGKENNLNIFDNKSFKNNLPNAIIYVGKLSIGKLTYNLMSSLDYLSKDVNCFLNFYNNKVNGNKKIINYVPKNVSYITLQGPRLVLLSEALCYRLYYKYGIYNNYIKDKINKLYIREIKRLFPDMEFDYLINYSGGSIQVINMYALMKGYKKLFISRTNIKSKKMLRVLKSKINNYDLVYSNNELLEKNLIKQNIKCKKIKLYFDDLKKFTENINNVFFDKDG